MPQIRARRHKATKMAEHPFTILSCSVFFDFFCSSQALEKISIDRIKMAETTDQ